MGLDGRGERRRFPQESHHPPATSLGGDGPQADTALAAGGVGQGFGYSSHASLNAGHMT